MQNLSIFKSYLIFALVLCCLSIIACRSAVEDAPIEDKTEFVPQKPPVTGDSTKDAGTVGDFLRPEFHYLLRDPGLYSVTREFGYSKIVETKFPFSKDLFVARVKPWSSWWFPKKDRLIFEASSDSVLSTLQKYDLVRKSRSKKELPSAAEFERRKHEFAQFQSWEGLCDAWSIAALLRQEPRKHVKINLNDGSDEFVTFTVSDLKALMLKTYEASDGLGLNFFGQKFTGNMTGWIYPDIFPEQFHRFVEVELNQNQNGFVIDSDPGHQVWSLPVFKANYTVDSIPNEPSSVFVRMWLYTAEPLEENARHFVGTVQAIREYNYVLNGDRNESGELVIKSGYWTIGPSGIDSRKDHPDYILKIGNAKAMSVKQKSWNPEIDVTLVNEILSASY